MRTVTKSLLTLPVALFLTSVPGRADTFIFNDLNDIISLTQVGSNDTFSGGCTLESCYLLVSTKNPSQEALRLFPILYVAIADPGGATFSDAIVAEQPIDVVFATYAISFASDPTPPSGTNCRDLTPPGCQMTEDGTFQTAGTVNWFSPGTSTVVRTDTLIFASDASLPDSETPEPSSLLLFATGLLTLVTFTLSKQGR